MPRTAKKATSKAKAKKVSPATAAAAKGRKRTAQRQAKAARPKSAAPKVSKAKSGHKAAAKAPKRAKLAMALSDHVSLDMPIPPIAEAIDLIPYAQLAESLLNPRHDFDEGKLWELARSIAVDGVLQNLVARPTDRPDRFEIVSGARRFRAVGLLISEGKLTPQYKLPVRLKDCTDLELIRMATVENVQRADMHPLEEGECFRALRAAGDTTENIANLIGKSQRWVQKRIDLVERLSADAKACFRAGEITVRHAQALSKAEPKRQGALINSLQRGFLKTEKDIVEKIAEDMPPVKAALFDRALYTGEIVQEDDGPGRNGGGAWFQDVAQFEKLQTEAIAAKKAELAAKWAWVEIVPKGQYFSEYNFERSSNPKKAGAVIKIGHDFEVDIHEGLVARGKLSPHASTTEKKLVKKSTEAKKKAEEDGDDTPSVKLTQALMVYGHNRKSEALQDAIAFDWRSGVDGPRAAMIMVILSILRGNECAKIRPDDIRNDDSKALSARLVSELDRVTAVVGDLMHEEEDDRDVSSRRDDRRDSLRLLSYIDDDSTKALAATAEAFRRLWALPIDDLNELFAILVASRCGTFVGFRAEAGDSPLAVAIAEALGVNMASHWSPTGWESYLPLLMKARLVRLCWDMPALMIAPGRAARMQTKALAAEILQTLDAKPELKALVPIELTFTSTRAIEDALTAPVTGAPAAGEAPEPPAPAETKKAAKKSAAKKAAKPKAAKRPKPNGHAATPPAE